MPQPSAAGRIAEGYETVAHTLSAAASIAELATDPNNGVRPSDLDHSLRTRFVVSAALMSVAASFAIAGAGSMSESQRDGVARAVAVLGALDDGLAAPFAAVVADPSSAPADFRRALARGAELAHRVGLEVADRAPVWSRLAVTSSRRAGPTLRTALALRAVGATLLRGADAVEGRNGVALHLPSRGPAWEPVTNLVLTFARAASPRVSTPGLPISLHVSAERAAQRFAGLDPVAGRLVTDVWANSARPGRRDLAAGLREAGRISVEASRELAGRHRFCDGLLTTPTTQQAPRTSTLGPSDRLGAQIPVRERFPAGRYSGTDRSATRSAR